MLMRFTAFLVASLAAVVALMAAVNPAIAAAEPMPNGIPGTWQLRVNEEFTSDGLNTALWTPGLNSNASISGPMSEECLASKNVSQPGNGYLYLQLRKEKATCGGKNVEDTGGLIESNPDDGVAGHSGFSYTYGVVEWEAYVPGVAPEGRGCPTGGCLPDWPALWSLSSTNANEIDTMEGLETLGQACYHLHPPPGSAGPGACLSGSYAGAWHKFASEWEPGVVKYFYDGAQIGELGSGELNGTPQYLIADMVYPGCCNQPVVVPDEMVVTYVRVWQHPPPEVYSQTPRNITRETAELASQIRPGPYEASYFFEYGTTTGYGSRAPVSSEEHLPPSESWSNVYVPVGGLKSCTTYDFRVVAKNAFGGAYGPNEELTTQCKPPNSYTEPPTSVTRTTALLEGQVYPNGVSTEYYFSYNEVGGSPKSTVKEYIASNEEWHWVDKAVSGLKSCTPYEVTVFAKNADGEKRAENTELFETECWPPKATTLAAKEVKRKSAALEGEVYPNGLKTEYWFEYGKKGGFGSKTTVTEAGSNDAWHAEHATYSSLEPCHEYQYRVVAENEDSHNGPPKGDVYGETKYFETKCKPKIQNAKVSHLEPGSVVLEAEVNPEEAEMMYHFEYDTREYKQGEAAHGTSVPLPEPSAGSGTSFVKESIAVVKLIPGQTYYFNVATHNESGPTTKEGSFHTPVDWELNSKVVTSPTTATGEGTVVIGHALGATECTVKEEGTVGSSGMGEVSKVTGSKGESVLACHATPGSSWCSSKTMLVEPVNLPWKTELVDEPVKNEAGEVVRYEVRERFFGASEKEPGWKVKCEGESSAETCVGEHSGNVENVTAGVPVEFDPRSVLLSCSGIIGGKYAVEGAVVFKSSTEGSTLSVYGAAKGPLPPAVVTGGAGEVSSSGAVLHGTVAAKGVATTYQFEYGTSKAYGSKIPASPESAGEGRTRVEVTQAVTGLESGVLYHYRLVASNSAGMSYGEDKMVTPGYPTKWLVNGKESIDASVKNEGTVIIGHVLGATECQVVETGQVGTLEGKVYNMGEVSKVTGSKGESVLACHATPGSSWCSSKTMLVEPVNLPWKTELVDEPVKNEAGEVVRYEVRERFFGASEKEPGWKVKCEGESSAETCVGEHSGNVENVTAGVPVEFDPRSVLLSCSGIIGGKYAVEGAVVFKSSTEGSTLSVYGAAKGPLPPAVVTGGAGEVSSSGAVLHGTVAAKGVATTYQFEYGTSKAYGSKIPASPESAGEGRTRVEVTQAVTGLESGVLYHYRLVASNSAGMSYGEDKMVTPGYPTKWLVNGKESIDASVKNEGTVIIGHVLGATECQVVETGQVGTLEGKVYNMGEVSKVTGSKGESVLACHATPGSSWCSSKTMLVEPVNLPWKTELVDEPVKNEAGEVVRYEVRERFFGASEKEPGWKVKCEGESSAETCVGEHSGNVENVTAGVPVEFDPRSVLLSCSGIIGGKYAVEGAVVFKSSNRRVHAQCL